VNQTPKGISSGVANTISLRSESQQDNRRVDQSIDQIEPQFINCK